MAVTKFRSGRGRGVRFDDTSRREDLDRPGEKKKKCRVWERKRKGKKGTSSRGVKRKKKRGNPRDREGKGGTMADFFIPLSGESVRT